MTALLNTLSSRAPAFTLPNAMLAVFDGFTIDPVRGRLSAMSKEMDRALPRTRLFRH